MQRLTELVDAYALRVYPAVLEQHSGASVSSPLGIWLLLAACADEGSEERSLLEAFLADPPPALQAAIALWVRAGEQAPAWAEAMPTKAQADEWVRRSTNDLIAALPLEIDELTRVVLASALAAKVSWQIPFEVADASEALGEQSPWRGRVRKLLWDVAPGPPSGLMTTRTAGVVAVHHAAAVEKLDVLSLSAAPDVPRAAVLEAAHEVARGSARPCSLFDLGLGRGHSWELTEFEVDTRVAGERRERIAAATLPAWRVHGDLDLTRSPAFGTAPALETLRALVGPRDDDETAALQTAVAAFTRYGFEAAAVTAFGVQASAMPLFGAKGLQRNATLRFDHPYVALAVARGSGLALFSAWVDEPIEP